MAQGSKDVDKLLDDMQDQMKGLGVGGVVTDMFSKIKELKSSITENTKIINEEKVDFGENNPLINKKEVLSVTSHKKFFFFGSEIVKISTSNGDVWIEGFTLEEVKEKLK